ncbi:AAA family ATPase [Hymenobacter sp. ASUV-10]|uniref:AAA family ATPase n=1 Tax=Hymenobacter aranciens TaxID=3063996 RepID=A0ABT9BB63_9BACT|nr:AAA family ATPase [Hymenobacter sp. ASUV-10]MDO7875510.1 AAA family ATPase [Hymenobacter sp. ASUV-10]
MKSETIKRLFRSIQLQPNNDLLGVARSIMDEERRKGHNVLVAELENMLSATKHSAEITPSTSLSRQTTTHKLVELPVSRRHQLPLMVEVPREQLRHHMVLSPEVEERITRLEKEFVSRKRLAEHGLRPRQKILLYGAPGCGKSMGAERLAWDIGLPFYKVQFDSLMSSFLGESANNLRTIFESTKDVPCVLLLDECDFIAKSRTYGQDVGEMFRLVNMLLFLLEEYQAPGLLVATTNLENSLDKALFRRFDEVLEIKRPGIDEIVRLLDRSLSGIDVSPYIYLYRFAEKLTGMSAAQVVKIANDAAKQCILSYDKFVTAEHLEQAYQEISTIENT